MTDHIEILTKWAAENQPAIGRCIQSAMEALTDDASIRPPRTEAERRNSFAVWLAGCRNRIGPAIEAELWRQFPVLIEKLGDPEAIMEQIVWPQVEEDLRRWAIRAQAAAWVSRHMGDLTTIGRPERVDIHWRVPLGIEGYGDNLGQVVLDTDGTVIPELTTTRDEMLEKISGRSRPPVEAAQ
jgi:hypothetical protein